MRKRLFFLASLLLMFSSCSYADMLEFAQIGDVHYTLSNSELDRYLYFLSLSIKKSEPDFAVFLGDNIDKSREENVIGFMRAVYPIKVPYYIVLGSNDAYKLDGVEKEVYLDIVSAFNNNQDDGKKYYYFKPNSDFICVVLDNTSDFARSTHGQVSDAQLEWLENLLEKNPKKLFVIFHHVPLVPPRIEYKLSMLNTEKYENLIKKYKNIVAVSSGHYHQSAVIEDDNGVKHISAPAFRDEPHSYQLIKIQYDKNKYKSPKDVVITVDEVKV